MCPAAARPVVCVTGASGFLGSHVVEQCLLAGYVVRGTVRNAADLKKTKHLKKLVGASTRLELFSAEMRPEDSVGFDDAFRGCSAVIHTASPCTGTVFSSEDVHSAVFGTLAVLRASQRAGVKHVVMTSAMCAAQPRNEGAVICETNWADAHDHATNDNKFSASKILAEQAAWAMVRQEKPDFRLATILPTSIVGPSLSDDVGLTNRCLLSVLKGGCQCGGGEIPDESLSFIDVRDCAAHHIAAIEQDSAEGRYLSSASSMHMNEIAKILKDINPRLPPVKLCEKPCSPTLIDRTRQDSLGVNVREMAEIISDAASYFNKIGVKDARNFVELNPSRCSKEADYSSIQDDSKRCIQISFNAWISDGAYGA
jgi:nucleoside-diphosphate-sugar epimerase